jgi:hypothetical protein
MGGNIERTTVTWGRAARGICGPELAVGVIDVTVCSSVEYDLPRPLAASSLNHLKHVLDQDFNFMSLRPPQPGKRSRTHADTGARPRAVEEVL